MSRRRYDPQTLTHTLSHTIGFHAHILEIRGAKISLVAESVKERD